MPKEIIRYSAVQNEGIDLIYEQNDQQEFFERLNSDQIYLENLLELVRMYRLNLDTNSPTIEAFQQLLKQKTTTPYKNAVTNYIKQFAYLKLNNLESSARPNSINSLSSKFLEKLRSNFYHEIEKTESEAARNYERAVRVIQTLRSSEVDLSPKQKAILDANQLIVIEWESFFDIYLNYFLRNTWDTEFLESEINAAEAGVKTPMHTEFLALSRELFPQINPDGFSDPKISETDQQYKVVKEYLNTWKEHKQSGRVQQLQDGYITTKPLIDSIDQQSQQIIEQIRPVLNNTTDKDLVTLLSRPRNSNLSIAEIVKIEHFLQSENDLLCQFRDAVNGLSSISIAKSNVLQLLEQGNEQLYLEISEPEPENLPSLNDIQNNPKFKELLRFFKQNTETKNGRFLTSIFAFVLKSANLNETLSLNQLNRAEGKSVAVAKEIFSVHKQLHNEDAIIGRLAGILVDQVNRADLNNAFAIWSADKNKENQNISLLTYFIYLWYFDKLEAENVEEIEIDFKKRYDELLQNQEFQKFLDSVIGSSRDSNYVKICAASYLLAENYDSFNFDETLAEGEKNGSIFRREFDNILQHLDYKINNMSAYSSQLVQRTALKNEGAYTELGNWINSVKNERGKDFKLTYLTWVHWFTYLYVKGELPNQTQEQTIPIQDDIAETPERGVEKKR